MDNEKQENSASFIKMLPAAAMSDKVMKIPEESKVGKKLSDLTTKRLIIVVLAMLFSIPIFDTTTYIETPDCNIFGLNLIANFSNYSEGFNASFNSYIENMKTTNTPLILLSAWESSWQSVDVNLNLLII